MSVVHRSAWRRCSIGCAALCVVVICVWFALNARNARVQFAIQQLETHGGYAFVEWTGPSWLLAIASDDARRNAGVVSSAIPPFGSARFRSWLPTDEFVMACVLVVEAQVSRKEDVELLRSFHGIRRVAILDDAATDSELEALEGIKSITQLRILGTQIGVSSISCVGTLSGLRELDATGSRVTDKWLENLSNLSRLRRVSLCGTDITDQGVIFLAQRTRLEEMDLRSTRVTDSALESLAAMSTLKSCDLSATDVSCDAVVKARKSTSLVDFLCGECEADGKDAESLQGDL